MNRKLIQMGVDLYYNRIPNFSAEAGNDAFRNAMLEITGGKKHIFELDPMQRYKFFDLVVKTIDMIIPEVLGAQYDRLIETQNTAWGDKLIFNVNDISFFKVATVATGVNTVSRQRLDSGQLTLSCKNHVIKIYDEMYRFLSGRTDWATMVNRVATSFVNAIKTDTYTALSNTYSTIETEFKETGAYDVDTFDTLASRVSVSTGNSPVNVFGTKRALSKMVRGSGTTNYPGFVSQEMMNEINKQGYTTLHNGYILTEIQQAQLANSDTYEFAISNTDLYIIPTMAERIIKLGFEGNSIINERLDGSSPDMSMEYSIIKRYGVAIISAGKYGIYRLTS